MCNLNRELGIETQAIELAIERAIQTKCKNRFKVGLGGISSLYDISIFYK